MLPLSLSVKEGVCRAYMEELPAAEKLWTPLHLTLPLALTPNSYPYPYP